MKNKKKFRRSVFGVAYCKDENGKIEYIVLKRYKHWKGWEFPKGKVEFFETNRMAAKREVREETGLKVLDVKRFSKKGKYLYPKMFKGRPKSIGQSYHLFAVQVEKGNGKVKLDKHEHNGYKILPFKEAYVKLSWPNQKQSLKIVNDWLNE